MKELPTVKLDDDAVPDGFEHGRQSSPGVSPRYRMLAAYLKAKPIPKTKGLKLLAMPSGAWYWLGQVFDGKWVNVAVGKSVAVTQAIVAVVGNDLKVPKPAKTGASPSPRKRAKKSGKVTTVKRAKKS